MKDKCFRVGRALITHCYWVKCDEILLVINCYC